MTAALFDALGDYVDLWVRCACVAFAIVVAAALVTVAILGARRCR